MSLQEATAGLFSFSTAMDDTTTRVFLLFTAVLWIASAIYAHASLRQDVRRVRFWFFFVASGAGNIGLIIAHDVATFYLMFSLMTVASYGLIIHDGTERSRRAGRVYIAMGIVGEMLILVALLFLVDVRLNSDIASAAAVVATSDHRELVSWFLFTGFGMKAGLPLLHVWLPLAHPVAPTPASAVLSGAMIKAGLLGWMRFLPIGLVSQPVLGFTCLASGLFAAFYAAAVGVTQHEPKTVLAYSSVSQMGLATAALGVGLVVEGSGGLVTHALLVFAAHHALAKGALFLGAGLPAHTSTRAGRWLLLVVLLLPALDVVGAPFTSGAVAKQALKEVLALTPSHHALVSALLTAAPIASTLLMARFLHLAATERPREGAHVAGVAMWLALLALLAVDVILLVRPPLEGMELAPLWKLSKAWGALWPVLVGAALALLLHRAVRHGLLRVPAIPAGDILALAVVVARWVAPGRESAARHWTRMENRGSASLGRACALLVGGVLRRATVFERRMGTFLAVGTAFVLCVALALAAAVVITGGEVSTPG